MLPLKSADCPYPIQTAGFMPFVLEAAALLAARFRPSHIVNYAPGAHALVASLQRQLLRFKKV